MISARRILMFQEAPADSLTVAVDTTTAVQEQAQDTASAITPLNLDLAEASDQLLSGEFGLSVSTLLDNLGRFAYTIFPRIVAAVIVLVVFYILYRILFALVRKGLQRSTVVDDGLQTLTLQGLRVASSVFIGVMVLGELGFNVAVLIGGLGVAGLAVGFAARDTLENVISGITILMDRPFRIGDRVVVKGTYGTVREITLRSTRICKPNNEIMVIPNLQMINEPLFNQTMLNPLRIDIPFGIAYKEFPQEARTVILQLAKEDERLHPEYPPRVSVTALNESSTDMVLRIFVKDANEKIDIQNEYTERVREALRKADIEIPFPHIQLKMGEPVVLGNATTPS